MAAGQKQGGDEDGLGIIYLVGGLFIIAYGLYYFFHDQIVGFMFALKGFELHGIALFAPKYMDLLLWMQNAKKQAVTTEELHYLATGIGHVLLYPFAGISLILAAIIYFFHQDASFKDKEQMDTLARKLTNASPAINVTEGIDLINAPVTKGAWAMGQTPVECAKKHQLLIKDNTTSVISVDELKAKLFFSTQLGEEWSGHAQLSAHEKAIYTILAMYILNQRDKAEKLFEALCLSVTPEKLAKNKMNFSLVDAYYKQYADHDVVQAIVKRHAFKYTAFIGLLTAARKTGIVPNALYLWLKPIDRVLWYVLNNVGRKAVYIEAAAMHAHYLAESILGFAIKTPMVDEVVVGLEEAIKIRIIKDIA